MKKIVKVHVLVALLAVIVPVRPAWACACGVPDWSTMSGEEIVSTINAAEDEPRILAGQRGELPPAPAGYRYAEDDYTLVPLSV
jgi:hypothetical protein